jgi:hypothetical protein
VIWLSFVGQELLISRDMTRVEINMATNGCHLVSGALSFRRTFG